MRLRMLTATALTTALAALAALTPAAATATPAPHSAPTAASAAGEDWSYKCAGPVLPGGRYLCDNEHLGPRYRPDEEPVAKLVKDYTSRSLPPDALNGPKDHYHCYKVTKAFRVDAGPVAPAFELPGDSIQYHLAYSPSNPKLSGCGIRVAAAPPNR
ncbi:TNT domain-containing protein [Streptomyces sp. Ag109_G2-15]|uniref:TNT domain-containing protein n=1 Tax=Streptomyces sp. Ag109_G2-15 TaxID=1938850 RepID=UPI000BE38616|nr:TNT domain-containing protein [Streptomyces sp. Ag109_G2-15]